MEHAHAHGVHDAVFDSHQTPVATSWLQKITAKLGRAAQSKAGAKASVDTTVRTCPDPYFDVWLEKRLHGSD